MRSSVAQPKHHGGVAHQAGRIGQNAWSQHRPWRSCNLCRGIYGDYLLCMDGMQTTLQAGSPAIAVHVQRCSLGVRVLPL